VLVYAKDAISRAGVTSQLAGCPGIVVLDPRHAGHADVAVVLAACVDEEALRVIRTIREAGNAQVVLVLDDPDPDRVLAAADAGALAALHRRAVSSERLAYAVVRAARGKWVHPAGADRSGQLPGPSGPGGGTGATAMAHRLSSRDVEVLRLVAEGCDTAEIARRLAYSEPTIRSVIHRLLERLNVRNRPHAVAVALRAGII
jgi:DNA-binding NarL/FixJ family response regulator